VVEEQGPRNVLPKAGPLTWVPWPTAAAARYWLVYGALPRAGNAPTWGLATIDGEDVYETIYKRPREVTADRAPSLGRATDGHEAARSLRRDHGNNWPSSS
jgi:hypothetical protein